MHQLLFCNIRTKSYWMGLRGGERMVKCVSGLRQIGGFRQARQLPPQIACHEITELLLTVALTT